MYVFKSTTIDHCYIPNLFDNKKFLTSSSNLCINRPIVILMRFLHQGATTRKPHNMSNADIRCCKIGYNRQIKTKT